MNEIYIRRAENGWIVKYTNYISPVEEIYSDEEHMLIRVHQLVGNWCVSDRLVLKKEQP